MKTLMLRSCSDVNNTLQVQIIVRFRNGYGH